MEVRRYWRKHTDTRANERWGLRFGDLDHLMIIDHIEKLLESRKTENVHAVYLGSRESSPTRGVYAVRHRGFWLPVVYSRRHRAIITILPRDALAEYGFVPPKRRTYIDRLIRWITGIH